jgi:hypothetical protein
VLWNQVTRPVVSVKTAVQDLVVLQYETRRSVECLNHPGSNVLSHEAGIDVERGTPVVADTFIVDEAPSLPNALAYRCLVIHNDSVVLAADRLVNNIPEFPRKLLA